MPIEAYNYYRSADTWKKFVNLYGVSYPAEFTPGDVNGDGAVNITDVTQLISMVLNDQVNGNEAADINNDGSVNISDVTLLITMVLNSN